MPIEQVRVEAGEYRSSESEVGGEADEEDACESAKHYREIQQYKKDRCMSRLLVILTCAVSMQ